jgi:putative membrane protein
VGRLTVVFNIALTILVMVVLQLIGMLLFQWMTPFNDMEELKKGNAAVGLALGGKFLATAIVLAVAAFTNTSIWFMMLWFAVGYVCLVAVYWLFELITLRLNVSQELQKGNLAVGVLLSCVFIGTALAVSSLIV